MPLKHSYWDTVRTTSPRQVSASVRLCMSLLPCVLVRSTLDRHRLVLFHFPPLFLRLHSFCLPHHRPSTPMYRLPIVSPPASDDAISTNFDATSPSCGLVYSFSHCSLFLVTVLYMYISCLGTCLLNSDISPRVFSSLLHATALKFSFVFNLSTLTPSRRA